MLRSPTPAASTLVELAESSLSVVSGEPRMARPHEGLLALSHEQPSDHVAQVYDPVVCLVLQGSKETRTTERSVRIGAGQFLIVTHDLPVVSRVTQASPSKPYVALIASLDYDIFSELQHHAGNDEASAHEDPYALRVGDADDDLIDAFTRYLRAAEEPDNSQVLAPMAIREIHFRLLRSHAGNALRRLARGDRAVEPIARAIRTIRDDLTDTLRVSELARRVGLSPSALHHHFKAVTGTTPVQYQKQLRLLEARRLILTNTHSVTATAHAVGYSSPTHFTREYRRTFGHPPSKERVVDVAS